MRWCGLRTSLQVFSPCNYYAGVATTSNAVSFRSLWSKSVLQELVRSYHTQTRRYSRYTFQIFATSFLGMCASVIPVFWYTHHTNTAKGLTRAFLNNHSGCRKNWKSISILPPKSRSCVLEMEYLGNRNWYRLSVPWEGSRDYFVAQIGMKSRPRRSKSCKKNSIP